MQIRIVSQGKMLRYIDLTCFQLPYKLRNLDYMESVDCSDAHCKGSLHCLRSL